MRRRLLVLGSCLLGLLLAAGVYAHGVHALSVSLDIEPDVVAIGATVDVAVQVCNNGTRGEYIRLDLFVTKDGTLIAQIPAIIFLPAATCVSKDYYVTIPSGFPTGTYCYRLRARTIKSPIVTAWSNEDCVQVVAL